MDVLNLAASITINTDEYERSLDNAGEKTSSFGDKLKSGLVTAAKIGAAGLAAATTAVGALSKQALEGYASFEQLSGGVETLFKESSGIVMEYANNAYKTAGLSANQYMETVTSFSASLLQSLDGDTQKAAETADMAITDMADNANKMGTSIDSIQNAYQGFAKQNFTMLDNLKLGYGGTKEEMQRLLKDAEKLSGQKFDISSYADITNAIHIVQTEMGITGTTAKEAATTIEGSVASAKSAWENLVAGLGNENADLDTLIGNFVDSVGTAGENIIPRVEQILVGIGSAIQKLAPIIGEQLPPLIQSVLPSMLSAGGELLSGLANGILVSAPSLIETGLPMISSLVSGLANALPEIANSAVDIITTLADGISEQLPALVPVAVDAVLQLATTLTDPDSLGNMIDSAIQLIMSLADGLINALPKLIEKAPIIIQNLVTAIVNNAPKMLQAGIDLIIKLGAGLIQAIPQLIKNIPQIVTAIVQGFLDLRSKVIDIGKNVVSGVWEGIKSMGTWIKDKVTGFFSGIVDGVKDFLGIHSPSTLFREEIGQYIGLGVAAGIEDTEDDATKAAEHMAKNVYDASKKWADRQSKYMHLSYEDQAELWDTIQSQFVEGSEQYLDAEERAFDLREKAAKEHQDEMDKAAKEEQAQQEKAEKAMEEHLKKLQDQIDTYNKNLEDRAKQIQGFYGLFDEAPQSKKVSGERLLKNLEGQVNNTERFFDNINQLAERGVSNALVEEIKGKGPSIMNELDALLSLSDEKLAKYSDTYQKKIEQSKKYALEELGEPPTSIETGQVSFAESAAGVSSAAIANGISSAVAADGATIPLTINLLTGDGYKFASWMLPDLIKAADAAGTPIASTQYA